MTAQIADQLPWNPNNASFPSRKNLPKLPGAPEDAAWVWGKDDQVCVLLSVTDIQFTMADAGHIVGQIESSHAAESQGFRR